MVTCVELVEKRPPDIGTAEDCHDPKSFRLWLGRFDDALLAGA
jgi:hypothetical protein